MCSAWQENCRRGNCPLRQFSIFRCSSLSAGACRFSASFRTCGTYTGRSCQCRLRWNRQWNRNQPPPNCAIHRGTGAPPTPLPDTTAAQSPLSIFFAQTLCLLVVVLEALISSTTGTLLVPCIQPDATFAVEISGRGRFLNLEFFCQPLKHIIEAIRAETNVVFPVRWIEIADWF